MAGLEPAIDVLRASDQKAAALEVDIANANLRSPRPPAPGSGTEVVPASVAFGLALADGTLRLTDVRGTVAGASVAGQLTVELQQQPMSVAGEFEVSAVNLAAAIGMGIGVRSTPGSGARWPVEPFAQGVRRAIGQVSVNARQVELTPALAARNVQGRLHISESQLALQVMEGSVAGGRIGGELIFLNEGADVIARTRLKLTDANAAELLPGDGVISGGLALDIALEGTGKSPLALIGALEGNGRITLTKGRLARFDPAALTAAIRAADAGIAIDAARVGTVVESALAKGALAIRRLMGSSNAWGRWRAPGLPFRTLARSRLDCEHLSAATAIAWAPAGRIGCGASRAGRCRAKDHGNGLLNVAGAALCEGELMIGMSLRRGVRVDVDGRIFTSKLVLRGKAARSGSFSVIGVLSYPYI